MCEYMYSGHAIMYMLYIFIYSAGSDFVDVAATVVFPPGSDNGDVECFGVTIMNDMAFEKDEYFTLHFSAVEEGVEIHEAYLSIHILDDDGK